MELDLSGNYLFIYTGREPQYRNPETHKLIYKLNDPFAKVQIIRVDKISSVEINYSDEDFERRIVLYKLSLINLFENLEIPYLMFDYDGTYDPVILEKVRDNFPNNVKKSSNQYDLGPLYKLTGPLPKLPCGHDDVPGQNVLGTHITEKIKEIYPNIQLQICTTVNVFNIRYLNEVAQWIDLNKESFNFVYWNMMHDAWYFSIATLPEAAKQGIERWLRMADVPPQYRDEFDRIIDFMNRGASTDGQMLRMKIADLDRKRNQNLRVVAPELADLIGYQ